MMTELGRTQSYALKEADRLGHTYIGCEHLLLAALADDQGVAATTVAAHGVTLDAARDRVDQIIGDGGCDSVRGSFSPRATAVCALAEVEAERLGSRRLAAEHFVLALINEGNSVAVRVLEQLGVDLPWLRVDLVRAAARVSEAVQDQYLQSREAYERAQR